MSPAFAITARAGAGHKLSSVPRLTWTLFCTVSVGVSATQIVEAIVSFSLPSMKLPETLMLWIRRRVHR